MVPAALPLREKYDADKSREAALSAALAKATLPPPPMKGVPLMKVGRAVAQTSHAFITMAPLGPGRTLLDQEAYLRQDVSDATIRSWRVEMAATSSKARKARLLVQLGEVDLARHEPAEAQGRFDRAAAMLPAENPDRGPARFDAALALFLQGRFGPARLAFRHAAAACEGYHAERAAMDIPEPPFLDPLCGVASLAVCLRGRGMPYAKADVLGKVEHDGEGSNLDQLRVGAQRLGLVARVVSADERGLRLLPKPFVAHVKPDHFVAVVAADSKGVEYVCSDCGAWPGGPVRLTWKQWRTLEADRYLAVAKPGSPEALALASLPTRLGQMGYMAFASIAPQNPGLVAAAERILGALGTAVVGQGTTTQPSYIFCGSRGTSPHCDCAIACPIQASAAGSPSGTNDPVNLATAEEEYTAPEGLKVYNPLLPVRRGGQRGAAHRCLGRHVLERGLRRVRQGDLDGGSHAHRPLRVSRAGWLLSRPRDGAVPVPAPVLRPRRGPLAE